MTTTQLPKFELTPELKAAIEDWVHLTALDEKDRVVTTTYLTSLVELAWNVGARATEKVYAIHSK